jgi:hypothetical protein
VEHVHWVDTLRSTQTVQVGIVVDQKQSDGMALVAKEVMKGKEYMCWCHRVCAHNARGVVNRLFYSLMYVVSSFLRRKKLGIGSRQMYRSRNCCMLLF